MFFLLNIVPPRASWESSIYNVLYDYVIERVLGPKPISIGSIGGGTILLTHISFVPPANELVTRAPFIYYHSKCLTVSKCITCSPISGWMLSSSVFKAFLVRRQNCKKFSSSEKGKKDQQAACCLKLKVLVLPKKLLCEADLFQCRVAHGILISCQPHRPSRQPLVWSHLCFDWSFVLVSPLFWSLLLCFACEWKITNKKPIQKHKRLAECFPSFECECVLCINVYKFIS